MPVSRRLFLPLVLLAVVASTGCSRNGATAEARAAAPPAPAGTHGPVAEIDGTPVTAAELDAKAEPELQALRDQEYDIRRRALDELITERILEKEASARGLSRDELFRREVELKVTPPTPAEVDEVWEANKHRVGSRPKSEFVMPIQQGIMQERLAARTEEFTQELRGKAKVRVLLEQPRIEVDFAQGSPVTGPADAPITIVEFSDYLCPFCQRAEQAVQNVLARNPGKVRFVHRDFLLGKPRSLEVARAAQCAGDQGKFWEYRRDLLLGDAGDWSDADLAQRATRLGMDAAAFRTCLGSNRHDAAIRASTDGGRRVGVNSTPTFYVNGRRMSGVRSEREFEEMIQQELDRKKG